MNMRRILLATAVVALALMACVSADVSADVEASSSTGAIERIADPETGEFRTRIFQTHAEVVLAAAAMAMTTTEFLNRASVSMPWFNFTCPVRDMEQTIMFACTEKTADNLCRGRDWSVTVNGSPTVLNGTIGVNPCLYTTCEDMDCRSATRPIVGQTMTAVSTPSGCTCLMTTGASPQIVDLYYTTNNSAYPFNETAHCNYYACENANYPGPANVQYDVTSGSCYCWYPAGIYWALEQDYAATLTSTTRVPVTPSNADESSDSSESGNTPNPVDPDSGNNVLPTDTTSTVDPKYEQLVTSNAGPYLCPNAPSGLTSAILKANIDKFCCTSFISQNTTWHACGEAVFVDMPVSWSYCSSTIPSFNFCCEVERMVRDTYAYRGNKCETDHTW